MRLGIMQPYFLPYVGYFQLLNFCDQFVVYDDLEYTKKGWINRNRIQSNGEIRLISLNLKRDSDYLPIRDRTLADNFDRTKLLRSIREAYRKAPYFDQVSDLLEPVVLFESNNLFSYLENSISLVCQHLQISTKMIRSSEVEIDPLLRGQERVIGICNQLNAKQYINPIGGISLYDSEAFLTNGVDLKFINSKLSPYAQGNFDFVPALSIIDQIACCGLEAVKADISCDFDLKDSR